MLHAFCQSICSARVCYFVVADAAWNGLLANLHSASPQTFAMKLRTYLFELPYECSWRHIIWLYRIRPSIRLLSFIFLLGLWCHRRWNAPIMFKAYQTSGPISGRKNSLRHFSQTATPPLFLLGVKKCEFWPLFLTRRFWVVLVSKQNSISEIYKTHL